MIKLNPYYLILIALLIGGCVRTPQWVESIMKENYEIVKLGKYPQANLEIKYNPNEFMKSRTEIEKYPELFNKIVYHFYPDESHKLNFEYKYTATQPTARQQAQTQKVILRYFSRFTEPDLYAGYSLQFVVERGVIKEIYLFKTPLE